MVTESYTNSYYPAVVVGMVYALLPFMILAVYSSAEKLDHSLVEASRDLGYFLFQYPLYLPAVQFPRPYETSTIYFYSSYTAYFSL